MFGLKITIPDEKKWAYYLAQSPQIVRKNIYQAMNRAAYRTQRIMKKEVPVDTGKLRSSIKVKVNEKGLYTTGDVSPSEKYAEYVEYGTRPHLPPVSAIEGWARRHGLNPWALAKSISKKGTKANPFVERTYQSVKNLIDYDFKIALKETANEIANKLK